MGGGQLLSASAAFRLDAFTLLLQARYGIDLLVEPLVCNTGTPVPAEKKVN
jgi:hypothetical protein